jgi:hypothetical protein
MTPPTLIRLDPAGVLKEETRGTGPSRLELMIQWGFHAIEMTKPAAREPHRVPKHSEANHH